MSISRSTLVASLARPGGAIPCTRTPWMAASGYALLALPSTRS